MIGGFRSICRFLYFCGQSVVAVIMIDSSKKRNSLVGVEVLSPYVIERRSNGERRSTLACWSLISLNAPNKPFNS